MLAPLLFNIFFAAVLNVASTRFKADKDTTDALVHNRKKKTGAGLRGEAATEEPALATSLWGMLYADDAGIISQSPEQLRKMMGVIVVVYGRRLASPYRRPRPRSCSYARRGWAKPAAIFSVEAAGQLHNQTNEFVDHGGNVNYNADLSIEVDRRISDAW